MLTKTTKKYLLRFRAVNRDTFEAIRDGSKKVETRAASVKYQNIKAGDIIVFSCGKDRFQKIVKSSLTFKTIAALLRKYKFKDIEPKAVTAQELYDAYYSYTGYREKIKKFGLIALEFNK